MANTQNNQRIMKWAKIYEDLNIVSFTFEGITTSLNQDGIKENKKAIGLPLWKTTITKENYKNFIRTENFRKHNAMAVITGEISNITGIDFDDPKEYDKLLIEIPELKNHYTVKTNKGYHIYVKYEKELKTTTNILKGIDIRNDGAILYAPPTVYKLLNGTIAKYDYLGGNILPIPKILFSILMKNSTPSINTLNLTEKRVIKENVDDISTITTAETDPTFDDIKSNEDYIKIQKYITDGLLDKYSEDYSEWFKISCIFKNEFGLKRGYDLFELFSKKSSKYDKTKNDEIWNNAIKNKPIKAIKIGTLIRSLKIDNPDYNFKNPTKKEEQKNDQRTILDIQQDLVNMKLVNVLDEEFDDNNIIVNLMKRFSTVGDYDYAVLLNEYFGKTFKCVSILENKWYSYNNSKLWFNDECGETIRKLLCNDLYGYFEQYRFKISLYKETVKEDDLKLKLCNILLKNIDSSLVKLHKTSTVKDIMCALKDITIDNNFLKVINKTPYHLPLKNGNLIDIKTMIKRERTIDDYFSYECGADYIEMTDEEEQEMEEYFMGLFCNNKEIVNCCCDILKSSMVGKPLRYIYFFTGKGRNGKTTLLNIIRKIMNNGMDVISKNVFVKSKTNSNLNTEVEKLDKVRIGFCDELKKDDTLNTDLIKAITGGGCLNLRTLQKTDYTITPTTTLFCATNEMPQVDVEQATKDRLIILPFNNQFAVNKSFEEEMLLKSDLVFSYIMKNGRIRDNFEDIPEEMKNATNEYFEDNDKNPLKWFIDDNIEYDENERIKREDFRNSFNNWCRTNNIPMNTQTNKVFTTELKKYNIDNRESNHKVYYCGIKI